MKKAALHNLGCKVNAYETEAMQQLLKEAGYEIVPFESVADVYVVNTCSVTNIADKKSRQMLHRAKKMNPNGVVAAVGCYVQVAAETLSQDAAVDLVIGNNRKKDMVQILDEYFLSQNINGAGDNGVGNEDAENEDTQNINAGKDTKKTRRENHYTIDISQTHEYESLSIDSVSDHTRAFIKIQDGCNQFCSYCIIPYARGRVRSRDQEDILREAKTLVSKGFQEIVLTGIHISSYGIDMPESERVTLLDLMENLDKIDGLKRLRLGSLEPRIVTEEFATRLSALKTICPHFHLSLQSGCDATLKRMNRHYTTEEYENGCNILRKYFDRPAITTDVIVGFPGETEGEFAQTVEFLKRIGFYELHVFPYSRRAGTRAAVMENQVEESVKKERSACLLALDKEASRAYRKSFLGEVKDVVMEEKLVLNGREYLVGHTREYLKAVIPWEEEKKGQMLTGRLDTMLDDEHILTRMF